MQATPWSIIYDVEVVLPLEHQILLLRIIIHEGLTDEDKIKLCLQELETLDEKLLEAQQYLECYQARLSRTFNHSFKNQTGPTGHGSGLIRSIGLEIG